ncbi:DNRLRE domain-containing protein [Fluviicola sp.]|uniref:DNRLRE domain-containing protein n=1 Tax=Fluviicola sp. TaxID=1917219 RepID=UPI002622FD47|nr:DNRLRE domain-containing protein [Fluviicola sp.]
MDTLRVYAYEDAYTNSAAANASTNYGTSGNLELSKTATSVFRSYLKFDLSGIPANAVISSALLKLTPDGTENITATNSTQLMALVCNSSWSESTLNFNSNMASSSPMNTVLNSNLISGKRVFEIKTHIQAIVDGCVLNEGWVIRRSNEVTNATTKYFSRENGTASNRPQLEITYYIRPYVSAATITHTSTLGSSDGSISPTVVNGSATTMNYLWYNSGGTQIGTSQNLTGVASGWYGLKCYGSALGDTTYHAFVVGTVGESISFMFNPGPNYLDDARTTDLIAGSGPSAVRYDQGVSGTAPNFGASRTQYLTSYWGSERALIRYRLWIDPTCTVDQADLMLYGVNHINQDYSNASEFDLVTSDWLENGVAYINRPSFTTVGKIDVAAIPSGFINDTVNISSFFNIWKNNNLENYGMQFQLQSYPPVGPVRVQFGAGDAQASSRPRIQFTISVAGDLSANGTLTPTYDATNSYADVTLNLTPPSGAVSPYHYVISEASIPDFKDVYHALKDSIFGGVLDSTTFYGTGETGTSYDFKGLNPGQYHVVVFDKRGVRIYEDLLSINPINYEEQTNISFANDIFTTSAANGKAILSSYLTEGSNGAKLTFNVEDLPSGQAVFGLQNTSSALTSSSDILYGFQVQSGVAKLIVNGVVGTTTYPVSASTELTLFQNGANLEFHVAGTIVSSSALPSSFVYKTGVLAAASLTKIKYRPIRVLNLNFAINQLNQVQQGSCLGSFGRISGSIVPLILSTKSIHNPSAVLTNSSNDPQILDAGLPPLSYGFSNLLPGNYTLKVTFYWKNNSTLVVDPTPVVYNYNMVVASKIAWENKVDALEVSTTQSLVSTTSTLTNLGHAASTNGLVLPSGDVFVDFGIDVPSGPGNSMAGMIGFYNSDIVTLGSTPPTNFTGFGFVKLQWAFFTLYGAYKYQGGVSTGIGSFSPSDKYRLLYNPTSKIGSLYKYNPNGVLGTSAVATVNYGPTVPPTSNVTKILAFVTGVNRGFSGLSTNLPCSPNFVYAKLEKKLTGVKYKVHLNKFYFFYDEEYASTTSLTYNVYNNNNAVALNTGNQILTNTISGAANREYGDNRYSLDVTSLAAGAYVLEVTNEKGEKFYLRFIK